MVKWVSDHLWHIICGSTTAIVGYFEPVECVVRLMFLAIIADFVVGIWVSFKIGKAIKSKLMWRTAEKLLICIMLVMLSYGAYNELGLFKMHIYVAWGIFGFEFWSILESLSKVSDAKIFKILKSIMETNFEKRTGVKLEDK